MSEFLYLFRGGMEQGSNSPEQMQAQMQKWVNWMEQLGKEGKLVGGQPLANGGKVLSGAKRSLTDGPFAEGKEIVGGYLMVKANSLDEATATANGCPIFEMGGSVEIREVQQMPA